MKGDDKRIPEMVNVYSLRMAIEIVDLPIENMVIFHSCVNLPEGNGWIIIG
jgi:hypothetical protein